MATTSKCYGIQNLKYKSLVNDGKKNIYKEIVDSPDDIRLSAVNGTEMPYLGWVEITFRLAPEINQTKELIIPVLVMKGGHLSHPIIGFNVIEHILANTEKTVKKASPSLKRLS